MSNRQSITLTLTSVLAVLTVGFMPQAQAGERLLLRSGTVDLANPTQAIDLLTLPDFESGERIEAGIIGGRPAWVGTREKRPRAKGDSKTKRHFGGPRQLRVAEDQSCPLSTRRCCRDVGKSPSGDGSGEVLKPHPCDHDISSAVEAFSRTRCLVDFLGRSRRESRCPSLPFGIGNGSGEQGKS